MMVLSMEDYMQTSTSKLTQKYQTTIPSPVRKLLHLQAGDAVAFDIEDNVVHLRKARPIDMAFAKSLEGTLSEWNSSADEEAYHEL
jgi:AbrB family looped-hinge helix DNA binding protein